MSATHHLDDHIRRVTPDEVAHYEEYGWVMLRGLFSRELAAEILEASGPALDASEMTWDGNRHRPGLAQAGVEPFRTVAFSPRMGEVARTIVNRSRLSDVDVPIQFHADSLYVKGPGAKGTGFHQDEPVRPGDRPGVFNMWVALDEVTPDMGAIRYLSGVHREGPLGTTMGSPVQAAEEEHDPEARDETANLGILNHYPKLTEIYEWSPPFHYQPGDATVHHAWMIHGGAGNTTERERWGYILEYLPADTRFFFDGDQRLVSGVNQRGLPTDRHPITYRPAGV